VTEHGRGGYPHHVKPYLLLLPVAALAAFLFAACGDGPDDDPTPTPTATKSATAATGAPIVLENPTVTASGLKYVDQVVGTGATPSNDQSVDRPLHRQARLERPGVRQLGAARPARDLPHERRDQGFSEGLSTMKEGGKRTVFIPASLGYGARGNGPVPPMRT